MTLPTTSPLSPDKVWRVTLNELKLQMTRATFDTHFQRARYIGSDEQSFTVGVDSPYSQEWIKERLKETIERTLNAVGGRDWSFDCVLITDIPQPLNGRADPQPELPPPEPDPTPPTFAGFHTYESNWTATPDDFFLKVLRHEEGIVVKLVGQVIYHTWGTFADKKRNIRVWEWPVTMTVLGEVCGLSRPSVYAAVWSARHNGYVIMRPLGEQAEPSEVIAMTERYGYKPVFTLRLRQLDDLVDKPTTERPERGKASVK